MRLTEPNARSMHKNSSTSQPVPKLCSGRHAECLVEDLCFSVRLSAVWSGLGPWKLDVLEC